MAERGAPDSVETRTDASNGRRPTPRRIDLNTLEHVARELGRVYRAVDAGTMQAAEGTKRTFILVSLGKVLESVVIERRLEALEARAATRRIGNG